MNKNRFITYSHFAAGPRRDGEHGLQEPGEGGGRERGHVRTQMERTPVRIRVSLNDDGRLLLWGS